MAMRKQRQCILEAARADVVEDNAWKGSSCSFSGLHPLRHCHCCKFPGCPAAKHLCGYRTVFNNGLYDN